MMEVEKKYHCHACGYEISLEIKIGRRDTCDNCVADLHVCKNCRFYDPYAHNECRENISMWVKEKEESNFCAAFEFKNTEANIVDEASTAKAKLNALFSKLK
jgi:hypothetical protein